MKDEGKRNVELLSRREKEVVQLLLHGRSNKQIAFSLGISERTVEFHLRNIYVKEQVASRVELILKLGKAPAGILPSPVESTVVLNDGNIHNDSQPIPRGRWVLSLRNAVSLIKQEAAMTTRITMEDLGSYLREHPLLFTLILFLTVSLITHYVLFGFGLFYWVSYVLLGILLAAASLFFGVSWKKVADEKFLPRFHPLLILIAVALLPMLPALLDQLFLHTFLKNTASISFQFGMLSTKAMWMVSPGGDPYLYTERHSFSDDLWTLANIGMILLFLAGIFSNKWFRKKDLAPA
jgi:DNA-binding CsgD family transcriptional regulator